MKIFTTSIIILFLGIITCLQAQDVPKVTLETVATIVPTSVSPAKVSMTVEDFTDIASFDLRITYDPSVATPIRITKGAGLDGGLAYDLNTAGVIKIIWNAPQGEVISLTDDEELLNLDFTKVSDGTTPLTFDETNDLYDCQFYDANGALYDLPGANFYFNGELTFLEFFNPVTRVPHLTAVPGTDISIPINVTDFNYVGSISLVLDFDPAVLDFDIGENTGAFPDFLTINEISSGKIKIVGYNISPNGYSMPDGTLATLNFRYLGGTTDLIWNDVDDPSNCEYAGPFDTYVVPDDTQETYYINGSVSPDLIPRGLRVGLKLFLEGCFNGTGMNTMLNSNGLLPLSQPYNTAPWNYAGTESVASMPADVVDWILLELRQATEAANATGSTILAQKAVLLKTDGSIMEADGGTVAEFDESLLDGNELFLVVRHRNHLAIMSNTGATLNGDTYEYDFTTAVTRAYGGSNGFKTLSGGVCGMVAGDANSDGIVNSLDYNVWAIDYQKPSNYRRGDFNFDGLINSLDYNKWALSYTYSSDNKLKSVSFIPKYVSNVPK